HLALDPEELARERERRAPLPRARLGADAPDAFLVVVVGLGNRGVRLVAPGGRDALPLVVDARGPPERPLEPVRPVPPGRPPQTIDTTNGLGDIDPALLAHLLLDDLHREERSQILGTDGLERAGVDHGRERARQVRLDVVPAAR